MSEDALPLLIPYARQSRARAGETAESSLSIEQQEDAIREWGQRLGYRVADPVRDHDETGRSLARPGIQTLKEIAAARPGATIAVWKYDRFARNLIGQELVVEDLRSIGVNVVSVTEPAGKLPRQMLGSISEYFSDQLSERLIAIRESSARRGDWTGGTPPYGYRRRDTDTVLDKHGNPRERRTGPVVPHPDQVPIVREVFERFIAGDAIHAITIDLHRRGVPTASGGIWCVQLITRMLANPFYTGLVTHHGEIVAAGKHEATIDPDSWQAAQERRTRLVPIRRVSPHSIESWCEGRVIHSCGSRMYLTPIQGRKRRDGSRSIYPNFVCQRSVGVRRCGGAQLAISAPKLEAAVRQCLATDLENLASLDAAVSLALQSAGGDAVERSRQALADRRRMVDKRRAKARELWLTGDDDLATWEAEKARYAIDVAAIDIEESTLPAAPDPARYAAAAEQLTSLASLIGHAEPRELAIMLEFLGAIVVTSTGVRLRYESPVSDFIPQPTLIGC